MGLVCPGIGQGPAGPVSHGAGVSFSPVPPQPLGPRCQITPPLRFGHLTFPGCHLSGTSLVQFSTTYLPSSEVFLLSRELEGQQLDRGRPPGKDGEQQGLHRASCSR